jgi:hypothetical protein
MVGDLRSAPLRHHQRRARERWRMTAPIGRSNGLGRVATRHDKLARTLRDAVIRATVRILGR